MRFYIRSTNTSDLLNVKNKYGVFCKKSSIKYSAFMEIRQFDIFPNHFNKDLSVISNFAFFLFELMLFEGSFFSIYHI